MITHFHFQQLLRTSSQSLKACAQSLSVYFYCVTTCGCFSQLSVLVPLYLFQQFYYICYIFQYFYYLHMSNLIAVFAIRYQVKSVQCIFVTFIEKNKAAICITLNELLIGIKDLPSTTGQQYLCFSKITHLENLISAGWIEQV